MLENAGASIGKIANRNMITVGGNIVDVHPWSALPVALLALNADIVTSGTKNQKSAADEFFSKHPRQLLGYAQLVKEVHLPSDFKNADGKYVKFALTENDYPLVSIAVVLRKKMNTVDFVRVVVGALTLLPRRLSALEKEIMLTGVASENLESVINGELEKIKIANDIRVSKDYKKKITANLLKELLKEV